MKDLGAFGENTKTKCRHGFKSSDVQASTLFGDPAMCIVHPSVCGRLAAAGVLLVTISLCQDSIAADPNANVIEFRDRVVAAWVDNLSRIQSARGAVSFHREFSPAVTSRLEAPEGMGDLTLSPMDEQTKVRRIRFALDGPSLRTDGATTSDDIIVAIHEETIRDFQPARGENRARMRLRRREESGKHYRDPREVFCTTALTFPKLEDLLKTGDLKGVRTINVTGNSLPALTLVDPEGGTWEIRFDPGEGQLPVGYIYSHDGAVMSGEVSYKVVEGTNGFARFPERVSFKIWPSDAVTEGKPFDFAAGNWNGNDVYRLISLEVGVTVPQNAFVFDPPPGAYVDDEIAGQRYVAGGEN